ncbi:MAG: ADP-ribosylglycohydrolase family protein [Bacteroidales bacterium]|nr:ADP-ribosylglycohydrolase family protein [Bacteroidales bacterium]
MKTGNNHRIYGIIGSVIGDIVGSRLEFAKGCPKKSFKLFGADSSFTDDSVLTIAVADALLHERPYSDVFWEWGKKYPSAGFGRSFKQWLKGDKNVQGTSTGDGSGMRIGPVGFCGNTLDEVLRMAKEATVPTHNSVEGIKAAQAIAASVFLVREGKTKADIKKHIETKFGYYLDMTDDDMRGMADNENYNRELAEVSTPIAIIAFLKGNEYEDVVRTAVSYGGDTDTVACMAGSIAAAFYGVPVDLAEQAAYYLPKELLDILNAFDGTQLSNHRVTPPSVRRWSKNTVVVYGSNADDTDGEKGYSATHISRFNHYPMSGYPIHIIGTTMDVIEKDVNDLIAKVKNEPQTIFVIENVGIGKKANLGIETMAPLFAPLKDMENVYFVKEYWDYYQSR